MPHHDGFTAMSQPCPSLLPLSTQRCLKFDRIWVYGAMTNKHRSRMRMGDWLLFLSHAPFKLLITVFYDCLLSFHEFNSTSTPNSQYSKSAKMFSSIGNSIQFLALWPATGWTGCRLFSFEATSQGPLVTVTLRSPFGSLLGWILFPGFYVFLCSWFTHLCW